jgi:hypothetical protein
VDLAATARAGSAASSKLRYPVLVEQRSCAAPPTIRGFRCARPPRAR